MRLSDVILTDMKKLDQDLYWHDVAHERAVWKEFVEDRAAELNSYLKEDVEEN